MVVRLVVVKQTTEAGEPKARLTETGQKWKRGGNTECKS